MKTIYAITCNKHSHPLLEAELFHTNDAARKRLRQIGNERKSKPGVRLFDATDDMFKFLLGWEEVEVSFRIVDLQIGD